MSRRATGAATSSSRSGGSDGGRSGHACRHPGGPPAGLRRDGPDLFARGLLARDRRGRRPLGRDLCGRGWRADRARRARAAGVCRHDAVLDPPPRRADRLGRDIRPRARRHLHRQRPLSGRDASDGCALRHAVLARRADLLLAVEHRPLARHGRDGAGRVLGQRHLGRAGGAAPAARQALQARGARPRDLADHLLEHPRRRPAHRGCERAGLGAHRGGRAARAAA